MWDVSDEALYPRPGSLSRDTWDIGQPGLLEYAGELEYPGSPSSTTDLLFQPQTRIILQLALETETLDIWSSKDV